MNDWMLKVEFPLSVLEKVLEEALERQRTRPA